MNDEPTPDPIEANAYAITFRLLGDRPAARAAALIAVERARTGPEGQIHLAGVALEAARSSSGPLTEGRRVPSGGDRDQAELDTENLRAALRRRLASSSDQEATAAALHHLAGHPIDQVGVFMGIGAEQAADLAGVIAPPPGVSYRPLGDPLLTGSPAADITVRAWARRPRAALVRWPTVAVTLVLVVAVIAVGRSEGARPTLGPELDEQTGVLIGPDVDPSPSPGCERVPSRTTTGVITSSVLHQGFSRAYRLAAPNPSAESREAASPRGLIVALTGYGQTAEEFHDQTDLEARANESGYLVATVEPAAPQTELNADPTGTVADDSPLVLAMTDDILTRHCVDQHRVHVAGFGPGAQLAGSVVCSRPTLFASAVAVSGALLPRGCALDPPVSLLQVWNADDDVLPLTGGYGAGLAAVTDPASSVPRPPAEAPFDVFARWGDLLQARSATSETVSGGATLTERRGGVAGSAVRSLVSPSGGHGWGTGTADEVMAFVRDHARST